MPFGGILYYKLKLQNSVALLSTEAEYMATTKAGKEVLWVVQFLACLGSRLPSQPVDLYADNKKAIPQTKNPDFYWRTKQIQVCWQ